MAIVAHIALLLLPLQSWNNHPKAPLNRITVQLDTRPAPQQDEPGPQKVEESLPDEETATTPEVRARVATEPAPETEKATHEPSEQWTESQPAVLPKARHLLESIGSLHESNFLTQPEAQKPALGGAPKVQMPPNWERNAGADYLANFDNVFNGMTAPEKVEIVDRWLDADGSHRVVVNLPNGETMCGRAEPYNPMQPLVENIMLFGPCGGGGKRSFSMPERYHLNR